MQQLGGPEYDLNDDDDDLGAAPPPLRPPREGQRRTRAEANVRLAGNWEKRLEADVEKCIELRGTQAAEERLAELRRQMGVGLRLRGNVASQQLPCCGSFTSMLMQRFVLPRRRCR